MRACSAAISASRRSWLMVDATFCEIVITATVRGPAHHGQAAARRTTRSRAETLWTAAARAATLCSTMDHAQASAGGSICDVPGIVVGHATDQRGVTGCTVILCEAGAVGGIDVRGAAPGTRETDLLRPDCTVERVNAILLSG